MELHANSFVTFQARKSGKQVDRALERIRDEIGSGSAKIIVSF
jgi:hypothetical protein